MAPESGEAPSPVRRSVGTEDEPWGQAAQNGTYTGGSCHSPVCPSLRHESMSADQGWMLDHGGGNTDPGRGPQPEGMEMRSSTSGNACGRSLDHHRSKVPLLSDVQRPGLPLKLLSSGTGSCLHGHYGGLLLELSHVPLPSPTPPQSG